MKKSLWAGIAAGGVLLIAMIVLGISGKEYFLKKFPAICTVAGVDVSGKSVSEAVECINAAQGMILTLDGGDQKTYELEMSAYVERHFQEDEIAAARQKATISNYFLHRPLNVSLVASDCTVQKKQLQEEIHRILPEPEKYTADAYFDSEWNLVEEIQGEDVDYEQLISQITTDLQEGEPLTYSLSDFYYKPQIKASDVNMKKIQKKLEKYKNTKITITFGEEKEVIDGNEIGKHLTYKNGKLKFDTKWVTSYVSNLAKKYNTYGKTRTFHSTKDGEVKIRGGIMGWWIDESATTKKITKLLKAQKTKTLEPVYKQVAAQHGKDDIGDTYVEISLKRQHLWFYQNGKLKMQSDVVTGLPTKDRETVKGVHRIYGKQRDRYLGTMAVQGYHTHVNYWMPFNWSGQGLHDATWRSRFGGNLYQRGGSHGCVNMPKDQAAKLYGYVKIGTPVVVY